MTEEVVENASSNASLVEEEVDEQEGKFLTFPLHKSLYGIEIRFVVEVVIRDSTSEITEVPHMPAYTKGVINLRGKIIPVIDLRARFLLPEIEYDEFSCFVVVNIQGVTTGLIVDTVSGVVSIPKTDIDPSPELDDSTENQFIAGMGKTKNKVYILLNIEELLQKKELDLLRQTSS